MDLDRFIADCCQANADSADHVAVREVLTRSLDDPDAVMRAVGEPQRAGVDILHRTDDLTILNVVWGPRMTVMPHNHNMWAVIGIYAGREDNVFWRRVPDAADGLIEAAGAASLCIKDAKPLGPDIIHSVTNPLDKLSGAIHIYGGDFFDVPRSEWDPETLHEGGRDNVRLKRLFDDANALIELRQAQAN